MYSNIRQYMAIYGNTTIYCNIFPYFAIYSRWCHEWRRFVNICCYAAVLSALNANQHLARTIKPSFDTVAKSYCVRIISINYSKLHAFSKIAQNWTHLQNFSKLHAFSKIVQNCEHLQKLLNRGLFQWLHLIIEHLTVGYIKLQQQ